MSDENNKRYIGEVFIDGKSNKLLQEFLTNLFNSYNGKDKGFNADMVDDWHLKDITDYVDEQVATKLDKITIGQTTFTVYDSSKFLQLTDIIYSTLEDMPWTQEMKEDAEKFGRTESSLYDEDGYYFASDIIIDLYYYLDKTKASQKDFNDLKTKYVILRRDHDELQEDFEEFKEPFEDIIRDVEITDENGNKTTIKMLDAQMINGFRIIPITQAKYDALHPDEKFYWRNIYIIVDNVPEDYVNPISYKLFESVRLVYNPETKYLEYYDGLSREPRQLISLEDIFRNMDLSEQINNYMTTTTEVIYNPIALRESIKEVVWTKDELDDLPFLTKDEAKVLTSNITTDYGTITSARNTTDNFTTFNITHAFDTKFNALASNISNVETTLRQFIGSEYPTKTYVDTQLRNINSNINTVNNRINTKVSHSYGQYFLPFFNGQRIQASDNTYGLSITVIDNVAILNFNNPVVKFEQWQIDQGGQWQNIYYQGAMPKPLVGTGDSEDPPWPQNYYANTSAMAGEWAIICRVRVTKTGHIQVFVEDKLIGKTLPIGWGQLVIPIPDGVDINAALRG